MTQGILACVVDLLVFVVVLVQQEGPILVSPTHWI